MRKLLLAAALLLPACATGERSPFHASDRSAIAASGRPQLVEFFHHA